MLPKTSTYVKSYNGQTKRMCFLIEDEDLVQIYNIIWDKVKADIKKEFDSEPVYNKNILKTKIESHGNEGTNLSNKEIPKANSNQAVFKFSINRLRFCSEQRLKLLSISIFKRV